MAAERPVVSRQIRTIEFPDELIFLGTGTSVGVPAIGCGCPVCTSGNAKNQRTRASVVLGLPAGNLLIDTSPDMRWQLLREGIGVMHAALFTHDHSDHLMGLDDVRLFPFYLGHAFPLYCELSVEQRIRRCFDYAFDGGESTHAGAVPKLEFRRITTDPFQVLGATVTPLRLRHGRFDVLGFRMGDVAYCTDTNEIPPESWPLLENLDVLVLDALRDRPHPTHFSLNEALEVIERLRPRRALLTHLSHELDHKSVSDRLPAGVQLAFDGLRVPLS
jgi:phosphoribosyl 1,2-cyclic phosphate phosphodiesterase